MEYSLIALAGTAAEHIYRDDFPQLLSLVLNGKIPRGANSDWQKLKNSDSTFCFDALLLIHSILTGERWIVLTQVADELFDHRKLNAADITDIVQRVSTAYRNSKRLASIERKHFNRLSLLLNHAGTCCLP